MIALIFFIPAIMKPVVGIIIPSAILKSLSLEALFRDTRMPALLKNVCHQDLRRFTGARNRTELFTNNAKWHNVISLFPLL